MRKILQIKKGEYLLEILNGGKAISTTYNQDVAMDISGWSLQQVGHVVANLKKVGYNKAKILTIDTEVKEEVKTDEVQE